MILCHSRCENNYKESDIGKSEVSPLQTGRTDLIRMRKIWFTVADYARCEVTLETLLNSTLSVSEYYLIAS